MKKTSNFDRFLSVILAIGIIIFAWTVISTVFAKNPKEKDKIEMIANNNIEDNEEISISFNNYSIDSNAIIVNYDITSNKKLNLEKDTNNLTISTYTTNNKYVDVNYQTYVENGNNKYKFSTYYLLNQFNNVDNEIPLSIFISEIAGININWNYSFKVDNKSNKKLNKYVYNSIKDFNISNKIPIKTSYTPISLDVKSVFISNNSGIMNISIYNNQNGISEENRIDSKESISTSSEEYNSEKWKKLEPLLFVIKDDKGNVLRTYKYDYQRSKLVDSKTLLFPEISDATTKLILNIYLIENNNELVGTINLDLNETTILSDEKFELDTNKEIADGKTKFKISSKWDFHYDDISKNTFETKATDEKGNTIELIFERDTQDNLEYYGINEYENIKDLTQKYAKYEMNSFDEAEIIDEGEETIGAFSGYQITYYAKSNGVYYKSKIMYTDINNEIYAIKISANTENTFDNNYDFCNDIIKSIQFIN